MNYDNPLVVTITVTCNLWAPSSGDHLFTCGAVYLPPHKALGTLVKSAHKNWKKAKEDKFCALAFDAFLKLYKNEGSVDVRNMLSDSRKKIIDQNKTRLRQAMKFVELCSCQERISKKQDATLVGRTPSFHGENRQLFIHKLSDFLDYSNHKQFFLFKAFASITSAPPLRKILAAPLDTSANL